MANIIDFTHKSFLFRLCHTIQFDSANYSKKNSNLIQLNIFEFVEFHTLHNVIGHCAFISFSRIK